MKSESRRSQTCEEWHCADIVVNPTTSVKRGFGFRIRNCHPGLGVSGFGFRVSGFGLGVSGFVNPTTSVNNEL